MAVNNMFVKTYTWDFNIQTAQTINTGKTTDVLGTIAGVSTAKSLPIDYVAKLYLQNKSRQLKVNKAYQFSKNRCPDTLKVDWKLTFRNIIEYPNKEDLLDLILQLPSDLSHSTSQSENEKIQNELLNELKHKLIIPINTFSDKNDPTISIMKWLIESYKYPPNQQNYIKWKDKHNLVIECSFRPASNNYSGIQYPDRAFIVGRFDAESSSLGLGVLVDPMEDTSKWKLIQPEDKGGLPFTVIGNTPEIKTNLIGFTYQYLDVIETNTKESFTADTVVTKNCFINSVDLAKFKKEIISNIVDNTKTLLYRNNLINNILDKLLTNKVTEIFNDDLINEILSSTFKHKNIPYTEFAKNKKFVESYTKETTNDTNNEVTIELVPAHIQEFIGKISFDIERVRVNTDLTNVEYGFTINISLNIDVKELRGSDKKKLNLQWETTDKPFQKSEPYLIDLPTIINKVTSQDTTIESGIAGFKTQVKTIKPTDKNKPIDFNFLGGIILKYDYFDCLYAGQVNKQLLDIYRKDPLKATNILEKVPDVGAATKEYELQNLKNKRKLASKAQTRREYRVLSRKELYSRKAKFMNVYPSKYTRALKEYCNLLNVDPIQLHESKNPEGLISKSVLWSVPFDSSYEGTGEYWYNFFRRLHKISLSTDKIQQFIKDVNDVVNDYFNNIYSLEIVPLIKAIIEFNQTILPNLRKISSGSYEFASQKLYDFVQDKLNKLSVKKRFLKIRYSGNEFHLFLLDPDFYFADILTVKYRARAELWLMPLSQYSKQLVGARYADLYEGHTYRYGKQIETNRPLIKDQIYLVKLSENYSLEEDKTLWVPPKDHPAYYETITNDQIKNAFSQFGRFDLVEGVNYAKLLETIKLQFLLNDAERYKDIFSLTEFLIPKEGSVYEHCRFMVQENVSSKQTYYLLSKVLGNRLEYTTLKAGNISSWNRNDILTGGYVWDLITEVEFEGDIRKFYKTNSRTYDIIPCDVPTSRLSYTNKDLTTDQVQYFTHPLLKNKVPVKMITSAATSVPVVLFLKKAGKNKVKGYAVWNLRASMYAPMGGFFTQYKNKYHEMYATDYIARLYGYNKQLYKDGNTEATVKTVEVVQKAGRDTYKLVSQNFFIMPVDVKTYNTVSAFTKEQLYDRLPTMVVWQFKHQEQRVYRNWIKWAIMAVRVVIDIFTCNWYDIALAIFSAVSGLDPIEILLEELINIFSETAFGAWLGVVVGTVAGIYTGNFTMGLSAGISLASQNAMKQIASEQVKLREELEKENSAFKAALAEAMAKDINANRHTSRVDSKAIMQAINEGTLQKIISPEEFYRISLGNIINIAGFDFLEEFLQQKLILSGTAGEAIDPIESTKFKTDGAFI